MKTQMSMLLLAMCIFLMNCTQKDFTGADVGGKTTARCAGGTPLYEQYQISGPATLCNDTAIYTIPGLFDVYVGGGYVTWSSTNPSVVTLIPDGISVKAIKTGSGSFNLNVFVSTGSTCYNSSGNLAPKAVTTGDLPNGMLDFVQHGGSCSFNAVFTPSGAGVGLTYQWSLDGVNFYSGSSTEFLFYHPSTDYNKQVWVKVSNSCGTITRTTKFKVRTPPAGCYEI